MDLFRFANAADRMAVCNDGTGAGFYFRRGVGCGVHRWVIHLQGGGACYDEASCDERAIENGNLMTSDGWNLHRPGNGIHSPSFSVNPDFADANHVYVPYCSSDFYSGDREASLSTSMRHFRGRRILDAVTDDLSDPAVVARPNLLDTEEVLFSGSSAGGVGVMVNLDRLASQRLTWARVEGINDAGWLMSLDPFEAGPAPLDLLNQAHAYWNAVVDDSCADAHTTDPGACYLSTAFSYIDAPLFIQMNQVDPVQLGSLGIVFTGGIDQDECEYILDFADMVHQSMEMETVTFAFSPVWRTHGILTNDSFGSLELEGDTMRDLVGRWWFSREGALKRVAAVPTSCELP